MFDWVLNVSLVIQEKLVFKVIIFLDTAKWDGKTSGTYLVPSQKSNFWMGYFLLYYEGWRIQYIKFKITKITKPPHKF